MKKVLAFAALLLAAPAWAQPRVYSQAELDAMLAPIALQTDGIVSQVLIAATYPDEVQIAAAWSRANPHLRGEDAVRAVQGEMWDPAVKALVAFPELLQRMDESPQWLNDLGQAFLSQQAQVMDTVQGLRRRAQASGNLATTDQYAVYPVGDAILVEPRSQIVYVRYYDPYVVYGPWWWPYYYPVVWHPWVARPVFVSHGFFYTSCDWHQRYVRVVRQPVFVKHTVVQPGRWEHRTRAVSHPARQEPPRHEAPRRDFTRPHPGPNQRAWPQARAPEQQRTPVAQNNAPRMRDNPQQTSRQQMPTPHGSTPQRREMPAPQAYSPQRRESPRGEQRERSEMPHGEARGWQIQRGEQAQRGEQTQPGGSVQRGERRGQIKAHGNPHQRG